LKKEPPGGERFLYYRALCNNTLDSGHLCPVELGHVCRFDWPKDRELEEGIATIIAMERGNMLVTPDMSSMSGGLATVAPELVFYAPESAHRDELADGWQGIWCVVHPTIGYRRDENAGCFEIIRRRKHGLTGRRRLGRDFARSLADRAHPRSRYGFAPTHGIAGDVPTLPAAIQCPRCPALNDVLPPTLK
jgi:hypothetical protein